VQRWTVSARFRVKIVGNVGAEITRAAKVPLAPLLITLIQLNISHFRVTRIFHIYVSVSTGGFCSTETLKFRLPIMIRPSEVWKDYGTWEDFCKAQSQFSSILIDKVPQLASKLNHGKSCNITPGKYEFGGLNVVCEVVFEDGLVWLCRVGWVKERWSAKYVRSVIESAVTTMRYIKKYTDLPIPEVYAYEADSAKSELGAAYMFLEPFPGVAFKLIQPMEHQPAIQRQVARVTTSTSRLTFPQIGWLRSTNDGTDVEIGPMTNENGEEYGPFNTSLQYFQDHVRRLCTEWISSSPSETPIESRFICWLYEQLALRLDTHDSGPFPLMHPEPCAPQMLMTKDLELKGVVDWDTTSTVPWLLMSCYPALLKVAWPRADQGRYGPDGPKEILETRTFYVNALRDSAKQGEESASKILAILDDDAEKLELLDTMYYFGTPYWGDDGHRIYNYLFPDGIPFEEFRKDEERWWKA
jgi:hypothetical protein